MKFAKVLKAYVLLLNQLITGEEMLVVTHAGVFRVKPVVEKLHDD